MPTTEDFLSVFYLRLSRLHDYVLLKFMLSSWNLTTTNVTIPLQPPSTKPRPLKILH